MSEFSDGYLAGIFDGEGCVSATITKPSLAASVTVTVGMTDEGPVREFQKRFGGSVNTHLPKGGNYKLVYTWSLVGSSAIEALEFISKNCILKNKAAKFGLELAKLNRDTNSRRLSREDKEERLALVLAVRAAVNYKPLSQETIDAYLNKVPKRDLIIKNSNGEIFRSVMAAAKHYGLDRDTIRRSLRGRKPRNPDAIKWTMVS